MFVLFINISSNISSPETVSLYNIDDMYIDGMLLTLTQLILDFVSVRIHKHGGKGELRTFSAFGKFLMCIVDTPRCLFSKYHAKS